MKQMFIYVATQKEFIHSYPKAPQDVWYLRYPHRHIAHIKAKIEVYHNEREFEFIMVKHHLNYFLDNLGAAELNTSCENIAHLILVFLQEEYGSDRDIEITVSEDNENGCELIYRKEI